jgi:nucleotide-binding universal stress UspA family protein
MFRNILVPTDGSPLSGRAIKLAVRLAAEQKARVTGFFVGQEWNPGIYGDADTSSFRVISPSQHAANVKKAADRHLGVLKKAAAAAGVRCECLHVAAPYPYQEIVKAARRKRCDLICMASHGRRGISGLLLGSETSKVLAHAGIPVLVCR